MHGNTISIELIFMQKLSHNVEEFPFSFINLIQICTTSQKSGAFYEKQSVIRGELLTFVVDSLKRLLDLNAYCLLKMYFSGENFL